MKLCRFDLISSPGAVRSGVVYSGKIYETDGSNPVAVHEASDSRLLSPVRLAPSFRLFEPWVAGSDWATMSEGQAAIADLSFAYLNSATIVGTHTELAPFHTSDEISFKPCLAAIVSAFGTNVMPEDAELHILGVTLANVFFAKDQNRIERMRGYPPSRSHDVGIALGPVITTPDELEETTIQDLGGRRYKLIMTASVNEEEVFRFDTNDLPITLTDAICFASTTAGVRSGDVIAINLGEPNLRSPLKSGDEIRVTCDWLGTLASRVG